MAPFLYLSTKLSSDPTLKKIGDQMRKHPERRIVNAFTVNDIATIVTDSAGLLMVS